MFHNYNITHWHLAGGHQGSHMAHRDGGRKRLENSNHWFNSFVTLRNLTIRQSYEIMSTPGAYSVTITATMLSRVPPASTDYGRKYMYYHYPIMSPAHLVPDQNTISYWYIISSWAWLALLLLLCSGWFILILYISVTHCIWAIIRAPSQYKDRLIYVWRFPC